MPFTVIRTPRRKLLIGIAVLLLHILAILFLVRAFTPGVLPQVVEDALATVAFDVPIERPTPPPPEPSPLPDEGAQGSAGERATPREVTAPEPRVARTPTPAPRASSTGTANRSGGTDSGAGTGAGGVGEGTGSGRGGSGQGSAPVEVTPPRLVASISDPSLFPVPPGGREARIGTRTVVRLAVSAQGTVTGCRVLRSSGFPETDAAVCRLAPTHIRFEPARDQNGDPIASTFGYQQRYFN